MADLLRIQRRRVKGWKMPPNTVSVTRPGKWGNPFYPGSGMSMGYFDDHMMMVNPPPTPANCVAWFRKRMETMPELADRARTELRGKNLACFCRLCDEHKDGKPLSVVCQKCDPCHVDPLGMIANNFECKEAA